MPLANRDLWLQKFEATQRRDRRVIRELRALGWNVLVTWECQITPKKRGLLAKRICHFLELGQ
jgi:DNA mismatch endonuclease, patch repair protein